MKIHEKLRELRKEKGWTQEELAKRLHVSPKTISSYERGTRTIDSETMDALNGIFGYDWQEKDKKPRNWTTIQLSDIKDHNFNLSAKYYVDKIPVTLRVDIQQQFYRFLEEQAKEKKMTLAEMTEHVIIQYQKQHNAS